MPEPTTLVEHLQAWAESAPERVALTAGDVELTYAELSGRVSAAAAGMRGCGVGPGDRVVLAGVNTPAWVVGFLAALRLGAIAVPLNSRLASRQIPTLLDGIGARLLLVDETMDATFADVAVGPGTTYVPIGAGSPEDLDVLPRARLADQPRVAPDMPALLSFTSGTTSAPKGALIGHRALLAGARSWLPHSAAGPCSRTTVLVPLFHNTAYVDQLSQMVVAGGSVDLVRRYRTGVAAEAMLRRPPTFLATVPTILRMLMLHPDADRIFERCSVAAVGGSAMPEEWIHEARERWPHLRLLHAYGLTEFTSLSHLLPAEDSVESADSVGPPVDGVSCSIRSATGEEVAVGAVGEVWLAGPQVMSGYWRDETATADVLRDGWLRTGDLGAVDHRGFLRLQGRIDDVINRGGEKIRAGVLERLLCSSPDVADAVVVGVPDPLLGQRVAAAVVLRPGARLDEGRLRAGLSSNVPDYALPERFIVLDELPLAATGKPDRAAVVASLGPDEALAAR